MYCTYTYNSIYIYVYICIRMYVYIYTYVHMFMELVRPRIFMYRKSLLHHRQGMLMGGFELPRPPLRAVKPKEGFVGLALHVHRAFSLRSQGQTPEGSACCPQPEMSVLPGTASASWLRKKTGKTIVGLQAEANLTHASTAARESHLAHLDLSRKKG